MKKITAIYVIVNKINHKVYLGSTNNFKRRANEHFTELRHGHHINRPLQNSWNKYREKAFTIFPIEEFSEISGNILIRKETEYILNFSLTDKKIGYNLDKNPSDKSGKNNPNYGNRGLLNPLYGKKRPDISKSMSGVNHPRYGKKHTLEARIKMSNSHKGKSPWNKGKKRNWKNNNDPDEGNVSGDK